MENSIDRISNYKAGYDNFSNNVHKKLDAMKMLKAEMSRPVEVEVDEYVYSGEGPKAKKDFMGIIGSIALIAAASFGFARKGYNKVANFIKGETAQKLLKNENVEKALNAVKSNAVKAKDFVVNKLPEKIKSNKVVDFLKSNKVTNAVKGFKPETKAGLIGAAAGTAVASTIDGDGDGIPDMIEKNISILDSISDRAGGIIEAVRVLS